MEIKEILQLVNMLLIPLLYYLHKIDVRLTKIETILEEHEKDIKEVKKRQLRAVS